MIAKESVLLSSIPTSNTVEISSLIFLLTGQDFRDFEKQDSDEIKNAKRTAIKAYINKELFELSERCRNLKAKRALQEEKESIEKEIAQLLVKKETTEKLISVKLTPRLETLNKKLTAFRKIVELKREIEILKSIADKKSIDIIDTDKDDNNAIKFKVKEHLDYSFIESISQDIKTLLEKSNYENLLTAVFDKSAMDVVVNGKAKRSNGKGYCAFLSTTVALAVARYMIESAKYAPGLLVLDSPILSFKETDDKKPSESSGVYVA